MNFEQAIQEYRNYMIREGYKPKTISHYTKTIKDNLQNKDLDELQQKDLDGIKLRLTQKYQVRGNRVRFSGINLFCRVMLQRPDLHLTLPRPKTKNKDVLTPEQVNEILGVAKNNSKRTYAMILTTYDCALRKGEVINLNLADVHYEANELYIKDAKTGDGIVTISDRALEAIRNYVEGERNPEKDDEKALFLNKYGRRIGEKFVRYYVKNCAAKAGITKRVYPHMFRASCITHLLNSRVNPATVQNHARHKNFATTMIYDRPTQQQMHMDIKKIFDNHPRAVSEGTKAVDLSDRRLKLVDKLIAGELTEETFNNIISTLKESPNYKNTSDMYA